MEKQGSNYYFQKTSTIVFVNERQRLLINLHIGHPMYEITDITTYYHFGGLSSLLFVL